MIELEDSIVAFAARCVNVCAALPVKNVGSETKPKRKAQLEAGELSL